MKIFTSCHFPISEFTKKCIEFAKAIEIELIVADQPSIGDFRKKIKDHINNCVGMLFILELRESRNFSDWMTYEYALASGLNLPIGIINNSEITISEVFPNHIENLSLEGGQISEVKLVKYLFELKKNIEDSTPRPQHMLNLPFIRKHIKHHIELKKDGILLYETMVYVKCLNDGLKDIKHSIHMNYSFCWNKKNNDDEPKIEIINFDRKRTITMESITKGNDKYTWYFIIEPPLKKDEEFKIGWRTIFNEYFPSTREALKDIIQQPDYPFPKNTIEHHYFINNPTEKLELELTFEDGSFVDKFEALVFIGRSFSRQSIDAKECDRIKDKLIVDEFLTQKKVRLLVDNPLYGRNYAISWTLN